MDIVSHILIGWILCIIFHASSAEIFWILFSSILADIVLIPAYLILGKENKRFLWIAKNQDWKSFELKHPILSGFYDTTHSIFFAVFILLPIVLIFKIPILTFDAYIIHLIFDIASHSSEWSIKIFYPFKLKVSGFSDAWAWPIWLMVISWIILLFVIFMLKFWII